MHDDDLETYASRKILVEMEFEHGKPLESNEYVSTRGINQDQGRNFSFCPPSRRHNIPRASDIKIKVQTDPLTLKS